MVQAETAEANAPETPTPLLGRVLDGRYRIDALLGEGGLGQVFRATDRRLSRSVALKVMHTQYVGRAELRARFEREARALAALSHPNVVGVVDYGVDGDIPFLVMDLLEGRTLEGALDEGLPAHRVIPILRDVLRAVSYAHGQGLVHRDLKPANVFLQRVPQLGEVVRVLDFGLAKLIDAEPAEATLTRAGMVLGTPAYMSPEQATGGAVDARTDVYALGIMLFEMATGARPFDAKDGPELLRQHLLVPMPSMQGRHAGREVRPELDALAARATAKSRIDRFKDGAEMAAAVDALPGDAIRSVGGDETLAEAPRRSASLATDATALGESSGGATLASAPSERPVAAASRTPSASHERGREDGPPGARRASSWRFKGTVAAISLVTMASLSLWWMSRGAPTETLPPPPLATRVDRAQPALPTKRAERETQAAASTARPFDAPTPHELASIEARVRAGRGITDDQRSALRRYGRAHDGDPRPWLLMGHAELTMGARTDACGRYQRAFDEDPAARNDETMLHDLLVMSGHRAVTTVASQMVVEIYGPSALAHLGEVEAELASDHEAVARIEALRRRLEAAR